MSISLNGVALHDDLIWENEFDSPAVGQSKQVTILGNIVMQHSPIQGGREVLLSAIDRGNAIYGYFSRTQIQGFKTLEQNGTTIEFIYDVQSFDVVIKTGSIKMRPLLAKAGQGYDDKYTGSIILLEV